MINQTNFANDDKLRYRSPEIKEILAQVQSVLCLSKSPSSEMIEGDDNW